MLFITPYILTFLSFFSLSYLFGTYSFIHKNICDLYQISKTQLGFINGIMAFVSMLGVILFLMYTPQIKAKIITYFTWGSIGYMFPFAFIVLSSLVYENGNSPKVIFYVNAILMGFFRSIFYQSLLIMIKMHKQIYDKTNTISEHKYKLLTNIWSASYGMVIAFFACNWLQYSAGLRWQYLVIIGVSIKLITTIFIFFGLRQYFEQEHQDHMLDNLQKSNNTVCTLSTFLSLTNEHMPTKLYLINSIILNSLHFGLTYVLPVFFYSSGYKGNQGNLTALYGVAIIAGAYVIAISDYALNSISDQIQKSKIKQIHIRHQRQKAVFLFIFSISLFFFVITMIILSYISFESQFRKSQGFTDQSNINLLMILMCAMGFFIGGPLKSYFSYKSIKAMQTLQKDFEKQMNNNLQFRQKQEQVLKKCLSSSASFYDKIMGDKLQVGSSLITANRIWTYFISIFLLIISFYLIDNYLSYVMFFFTIIGFMSFIFDVIQNIDAVKQETHEIQEQQEQQKRKSQKLIPIGK